MKALIYKFINLFKKPDNDNYLITCVSQTKEELTFLLQHNTTGKELNVIFKL